MVITSKHKSIIIEFYFSNSIECSNEILGWEGVENRQLLCFFKA
jgi:hypothetical protein